MDGITGPSSRDSCDLTMRWRKGKCIVNQKEIVVGSACWEKAGHHVRSYCEFPLSGAS